MGRRVVFRRGAVMEWIAEQERGNAVAATPARRLICRALTKS